MDLPVIFSVIRCRHLHDTCLYKIASRDNSAGISDGLRVGRPGVSGVLSPGVKRKGLEPDHSPPSTVGVNEGGAIPPILHIFYGSVLY
jgi:hypothetical protein